MDFLDSGVSVRELDETELELISGGQRETCVCTHDADGVAHCNTRIDG